MHQQFPGPLLLVSLGLLFSAAPTLAQPPACRAISADVVALDQAFYTNRMGAVQTGGMIFALKRDVVPVAGYKTLTPGYVMLRPGKRPRPMVLRMNVGDCLTVRFTNLLKPAVTTNLSGLPSVPVTPAFPPGALIAQPGTRQAGVHVMGMQPRTVASDGSWAGANATSLVAPGASATYEFFAEAEGAYLLYSTAANTGTAWDYGGQLSQGLFGAVTVQPAGAEWYRSQVTAADMARAQTGVTADGHPVINYAAAGADGTPVLKMLNDKNEIVYTDLTAIITGPNAGPFTGDSPSFDANPTYPNRRQPYREFAIHYHDDFVITQAFSQLLSGDPMFATLASGRDMFAINYGTGGIGAEVLANRLGVGPSAPCDTCKFEEFFLSAWATGDPAMVVDVPANAAKKATPTSAAVTAKKALFPDDPSNVYHSYIGDHVKFRILHAGTNITHVHHQHAHQWLHTPNSDSSDYRDSQMISPGAGYTLDQTYHGSGNKNQTVGDSIFHCHFYPHFAQGMWAMWRTHDVFEAGTTMAPYGMVVANDWNRALPDGEIATGTPTPGLVPLPTQPMAPMPARTRICPVFGPADYVQFSGASCPAAPVKAKATGFKALVNQADLAAGKNPGFPFFVPGVGGKRAPHPPLDYAWEEEGDEDGGSSGKPKLDAGGKKIYLDGGLPRNIVLDDTGYIYEKHNKWDFSKDNDKLVAVEIDQEGTAVEKAAMAVHAIRCHPSFLPDGTAASCSGAPATGGFILNGQPAIPGAPYANPAVDLSGNPVTGTRRYKAAAIELDVVQNKKGWHYPQQRMLSLWDDVKKFVDEGKRPEPLFFRASSTEIIEFWHTNLVPNYYDLDDFQVRTPTDIIGQHIHLVKFDVTSSDGAGNGFNYEDGTLAPPEVVEQIHAINKNCTGKSCGIWSIDATAQRLLAEKEIPFFKVKFPGRFPGAQTTIQTWYADPLLDNFGKDRTMRTVFTHDHFGPSTHQQAGLYAGLVLEPQCADWRNPLDNTPLNGRFDGGPTSWQAIIVPKADPGCPSPAAPAYREFLLEFQDRTLAYKSISKSAPTLYTRYSSAGIPAAMAPWGWSDFANAVSPPANTANDPATLLPKLVTQTFGEGTFSVNYANEPLGFRIKPSVTKPPAACPADPLNSNLDLGHVFRSMCRTDPDMNLQPAAGQLIDPSSGFKFAAPFPGATPTDPYTPVLRAYEGDLVQIRTLVGAHMEPHSLNIQGLKWQFEPSFTNSGYRATQGMGISEHYEMIFRVPATRATDASGAAINQADYLYEVSSAVDGLENGNWGLLRAYKASQPDVQPVPGPDAKALAACPADAPKRPYAVSAVFARDVLDGPLVYNARGAAKTPGLFQIVDWNALIYVRTDDLDANGKLKANVRREPLILRAAAGDCIEVTLENRIPDAAAWAQINVGRQSRVNPNAQLNTSRDVGLRPQLVTYDVTQNDGVNAGLNPVQTIPPASGGKFSSKVLQWYAGNVTADGGTVQNTPIEFGAISLAPADPLMQHPYGLIGALIVEPSGATWVEDANTRASATVTPAGGAKFREFVEIVQDDVAALKFTNAKAIDAVVAGGTPQWRLNGKPLPNNAKVAVVPGDSVVFAVRSGVHGITFMNKDDALASLDFGSFAQAFTAQPTVGPNAWGTDGMSANANMATLLAALQVKPTTAANQGITTLAFECTVHLAKMAGVLTIQRGAVTSTMIPPDTIPSFTNWTRAVNYRTEPFSYRFQLSDWLSGNVPTGMARALSNSLVSADPETPVFSAPAGMPVRLRVLHPGGTLEQVFTLHGHKWQEEPYTNDSKEMGINPKSQSTGSRDTFGPNAAFDVLLPSAGGAMAAPGDYLLRTFIGTDFSFGMWNLMRVGDASAAQGAGKDTLLITRFEPVDSGRVMITGVNTVNPVSGQMATSVSVFSGSDASGTKLGDAPVDPMRGTWTLQVPVATPPSSITVVSNQNGTVTGGQLRAVAAAGGAPATAAAPRAAPSDNDASVNQFRAAPPRQPGSSQPSSDKAARPGATIPPQQIEPAPETAKPTAKPPAGAKPPAAPAGVKEPEVKH